MVYEAMRRRFESSQGNEGRQPSRPSRYRHADKIRVLALHAWLSGPDTLPI